MLNKQTEKICGQSFEVLCIERVLLTSQDDVMTWRFFLTRSGFVFPANHRILQYYAVIKCLRIRKTKLTVKAKAF